MIIEKKNQKDNQKNNWRKDLMKNKNLELSIFDFLDAQEDESDEIISQKTIDEQLCLGSGFIHGKYRIFKWFSQHHTEKENINFLAHEYGVGGWSTDFGFLDRNSKGLSFQKYKTESKFHQKYVKDISWSEVSQRLQVLIALNKYMNKEELEEYKKIQDEIHNPNT